MSPAGPGPLESLRLDKWLWAARFFKTRLLAVEAINGGKIHLNGQRAKPGKEVKIGSRLRIHIGSLEWEITVAGITKQRRPAPEAALLYTESEESKERRKQLVEERRVSKTASPPQHGRPTKRDRRKIQRFINKDD